VIEGQSPLEGVRHRVGCHVSSSRHGRVAVTLLPYCVVRESAIEEAATLGPFCHLRAAVPRGSQGEGGQLVELKKSTIGGGRGPAPLLRRRRDRRRGRQTSAPERFTCNYDGVAKHETKIGDRAFIGTNTSLVAPVTVARAPISEPAPRLPGRPTGSPRRGTRPADRQGRLGRPGGQEARGALRSAMCGIVAYVGTRRGQHLVEG